MQYIAIVKIGSGLNIALLLSHYCNILIATRGGTAIIGTFFAISHQTRNRHFERLTGNAKFLMSIINQMYAHDDESMFAHLVHKMMSQYVHMYIRNTCLRFYSYERRLLRDPRR